MSSTTESKIITSEQNTVSTSTVVEKTTSKKSSPKKASKDTSKEDVNVVAKKKSPGRPKTTKPISEETETKPKKTAGKKRKVDETKASSPPTTTIPTSTTSESKSKADSSSESVSESKTTINNSTDDEPKVKKVKRQPSPRTQALKDAGFKAVKDAYKLFQDKRRAEIKQQAKPDEKPDLSMARLSKEWKELSDDESAVFEQQYQADKKIRDLQLAEWDRAHPEFQKEKKVKEPKMPKLESIVGSGAVPVSVN